MSMNRPNILLITDDQHRWDFVGTQTVPSLSTPALDRLPGIIPAVQAFRFLLVRLVDPLLEFMEGNPEFKRNPSKRGG
jgi:hypothetical protein